MKTNRRKFIKLAGAAIAAPAIWIPSKGRAATNAFGDVRHLMVLFAKGGLRSHCLFNAMGSMQHNPFGTSDAMTNTEWTLGGPSGEAEYMTSLGAVPGLRAVTNDIAVLPCVDHVPGGAADVGHDTAVRRMCTGTPDSPNGLLSIIGKDHSRYANGFSAQAVPPVEVNSTDFGLGAKEYAKTRPLAVQGAGRSFTANLPVGLGWKIQARDALNARFRDRRPRGYRKRLNEFLLSKQYASVFAEMLGSPRLDVLGTPDGADSGVTNEELLSVLGNYSLAQFGDLQGTRSWGADVALGLRFFGFGSPVAVVTRDIYDMHDDERQNFPPRTSDLARQLAGLNFLLKRMDHPTGGKYWDKTMVVVLSEFSRNNTFANGFNSGNGSDHVGQNSGPARNQALAVMGGPVTKGGKMLGATDTAMNATGEVYSSRRVLSTMLDVIGIDHSKYFADEPITELFT